MKTLLILLISFSSFAVPYEKYFKIYTHKYFKHTPLQSEYLLFASQAKQESNFDSLAESPVGAKGVMQFMSFTWGDFTSTLPRTSVKHSIRYGVMYNKRLWNIYKAPRPLFDRVAFMLASYNAGAGNIIKAQKEALKDSLNPNLWSSIIITLPRITKHHSKETINYVRLIRRNYARFTRDRGSLLYQPYSNK